MRRTFAAWTNTRTLPRGWPTRARSRRGRQRSSLPARPAVLLGNRRHALHRDRLAGNADGAGLPPGGGRNAFIRNIRKNLITLITPVLEVDGREKEVDDLTTTSSPTPASPSRASVYWGKYVGPRRQPRRHGALARPQPEPHQDVPRIPSAGHSRPARVDPVPVRIDRHGSLQRLARSDRDQ